MGSIRIAVFEQIPLFRAGIVQALNAEAGMEVVAEGNSITEAICMSAAADVVIVDDNLLEGCSNPAVPLVALCSSAKVVLLTFSADGERMRAAFAAGVRGCVSKGAGRPELLEAVRDVYRGEGYLSPALTASMMRNLAGPKIDSGVKARCPAQLTYREDQIFQLLSAGLKNKEIGTRLNLSEKSIKRYVTCIFEKLNVRNRVEAAMVSRANPQPAAGMAYGAGSTGIARASQATFLLEAQGGTALTPESGAAPRGGSAWPILSSFAQHTLNESASTPARLGPSTAHCFHAIFGRNWPALGGAPGEPEGMPRGTHILL